MTALRFADPAYSAFAGRLLAAGAVESCGIAYFREDPGTGACVVAEVAIARDEDYDIRDNVSAVLRPAFLVDVANKARAEKLSVAFVHTHPFAAGKPIFSPVDDRGEIELKAYCERRIPGRHLALVIGPDGCRARYLGGVEEVDVFEVGAKLRRLSNEAGDSADQRYDRQVRAFGTVGQQHVASLDVLVTGAGGTGMATIQQLAYLGVSRFTLVDPDLVDETNLNRLIGATPDDIGKPKVAVAARMIQAINPAARVTTLQRDVVDSDIAAILAKFDFAFLCTDSHASRAVMGQAAYQYLVPIIDMGVVICVGDGAVSHITGRVQMLAPGLPCLSCSRSLDSELIRREMMTPLQRAADPYVQGTHEPQPAVISLNSTLASLAVTMFLGAVTPVPAQARFQFYDGIRGTVRPATANCDPQCIVCSASGSLAKGPAWQLPARPAANGQ